MNKERLLLLLNQYYSHQLSDKAFIELREAIEGTDQKDLILLLSEFMQHHLEDAGNHLSLPQMEQDINTILSVDKMRHIPQKIGTGKTRNFQRLWWYAAACLLIVSGLYFYSRPDASPGKQPVVVAEHKVDIDPGKEGAILTLSDGSQVVLDSLSSDSIKNNDGVKIQLSRGSLSYQKTTIPGDKAAAYNTITTPKGRQYHLTLNDGTDVWLNAASSINYPVTFNNNNERKVFVTGEVYFEVAKDKQRPFIVAINNAESEVEVLGTHFNIKAYTDEPDIRTTLLEGKVKVISQNSQKYLTPGEQSRMQHSTTTISTHNNIDLDAVMAWKNKLFSFEETALPAVMRELSRWYDLEVVYEGAVPNESYSGKMDKDLTLNQTLKLLAATLKYRIDKGNKITILSNQN